MPKPVRELLDDHILAIMSQVEPLRAQLAALERELADARKARNALVHEHDHAAGSETAADRAVRFATAIRMRQYLQERAAQRQAASPATPSPYADFTMKQLVRKALEEHFANGATANELLDFFRDAWGRNDIVRTSLSPQLSRLKREGVIILRGKKWFLAGTNETLALEAPKKIEPSNAGAEDGS